MYLSKTIFIHEHHISIGHAYRVSMLTLFVCLVGQVDLGERVSLVGFSFMSNLRVGYYGTRCIKSFNLIVHVKERGSRN